MLDNILKYSVIGTIGTSIASKIVEHRMTEYDTNIIRPIDAISIIIPTFNESEYIQTSLSSLRNQSIVEAYPEYFEFLLVDSGSTDNTITLAEPFVDKIIETKVRGKLTARNLATDYSSSNLIVAVDGDTFYPYHWLNTLLKPFNQYRPSQPIIATFGSTFDYTTGIPGPIFSLGDFIWNSIITPKRMTGRNSAYFKHAFYLANRFNESVNQLNIWSIFNEEERLFGNRLSKLGKIIYVPNASCYHLGGAKSAGRLGIGNKEFINKSQFGKERF